MRETVASFSDVELELTSLQVNVSCPSTYAALELALPHEVEPASATAKFTKKKKELRVDLRVLPGQLPEAAEEESEW